jgi:hypothetical protein
MKGTWDMPMQHILITLGTWLILVYCQTETGSAVLPQKDSKKEQERMPLSFTLEPQGYSKSFPKQKYAFIIKNSGTSDILLDKWVLDSLIFVNITDENGKPALRNPPPFPLDSDIVVVQVLKPGKEVRVEFTISDISMVMMDGKKYRVICQYDTRSGYPPSIPMWKGLGTAECVYVPK